VKAQLTELRSFARYQQELVTLTPKAGQIVRRFNRIHRSVECPHNPSHLLRVATEFLAADADGVFVEAGCFKGGSTSKLSIVAELTKRDLVVFDSFQGLPLNEEAHTETIDGLDIEGWFTGGSFSGTLDEVRTNVSQYGEIEPCRFVEGWFEDTMPGFQEPVAAAFIDVDLADSTRTCLKYLYPLLAPGGVLISQDGDFPLVLDIFTSDQFWEQEVGVEPPTVEGAGVDKLLIIRK
jgi:O-methyltransferase